MNDEQTPCQGLTDLFYDEDNNTSVEAAKQICDTCPFKDVCLQKGMNEHFGIWGGETSKNRRSIKRQIKKAERN